MILVYLFMKKLTLLCSLIFLLISANFYPRLNVYCKIKLYSPPVYIEEFLHESLSCVTRSESFSRKAKAKLKSE